MKKGLQLSMCVTGLAEAGQGSAQLLVADRFLRFLMCLLLGYAITGRGLAYIGYPPVYIGEVGLAFGTVALFSSSRWSRIFESPLIWMLLCFMLWCGIRTVPYIPEHRLFALRDGAIWGYGAFAVIVAAILMSYPRRLRSLIENYRKLAVVLLTLLPLVWILIRFYSDSLPCIPGTTDVTFPSLKGGDAMVHLAGILSYMAGGFLPARPLWIVLLGVNAVLGASGRAAILTLVVAALLLIQLKPMNRLVWGFSFLCSLVLAVLYLNEIKIDLPGMSREISWEQLVLNVESMHSDTSVGSLEGSKRWRLTWWNTILDYTLHGDYFWGGKGFGINLAEDDGFSSTDRLLRSPHNGHLTILARSGVPGFVLWVLVQLSWAIAMLVSYLQSTRHSRRKWSGLFLFLLAYWMAFIVNGAFDVFLEGPMGGIWFWCVYGTGVAAVWIYKRYPQVLWEDEASPNSGSR